MSSGPGATAHPCADVVLAAVVRNGVVEGRHHGSAVVTAPDGGVEAAAGDPAAPVLPRSCSKPLQAVAMLRAGLKLPGHPQGDHVLLALAQSSHSGEPFHLEGVLGILEAHGLDGSDLQNTPGHPLHPDEQLARRAAGLPASSLTQSCSGKHAAMLATCRLNGWPTASYLDPQHPLQRLVAATVAELTGTPVTAVVVDGCGAPAHQVTLQGLARAYGRLALAAADPSDDRAEALVGRAASAGPVWVGGHGRWVTRLLTAVPGLVAKDGAEAVFAVGLPDGRGLAVKIASGDERAVPPVVVHLLRACGIDPHRLTGLDDSPVLGHGTRVGSVTSTVRLR